MGQAKQRGTLEDRIRQSKERQAQESAARFAAYQKREQERLEKYPEHPKRTRPRSALPMIAIAAMLASR